MSKNINNINPLLVGCIADDITGASDLGLMLASNGLPTTLFLGVPNENRDVRTPGVVIALKIRTAPAGEAVTEAVQAARWLQANEARQLFYKYCSTFDSTADGNIGPVTDALLSEVNDSLTVLLPAFPENSRTVRNGHLYVDNVPLSNSSMRNHPLTPMTDSFIPNLMDAQTTAGATGFIAHDIVDRGPEAIIRALTEERAAGHRYVCIDTLSNDDLPPISDAIAELRLITGGSGIGAAIPETLRRQHQLALQVKKTALPTLPGHAAILAGSCSAATRTQIAAFDGQTNPIVVDPLALSSGATTKEQIANTAVNASERGNVLVHSSTDTDTLRNAQQHLGISASAALVEETLAFVAQRLAASGIGKFIVAGGETSGAVANALGINQLEIGTQIDPGVPWMIAAAPQPSCLAFKSGNFGRPDFFQRALDLLP